LSDSYLIRDPYKEFRQTVDRGEDKIDLGRAALTLAAVDYPDLDIDIYLARIDRLAAEAQARLGSEADVHRTIAVLNDVLFRQHGFRGNRDNYFDPRNSFLNEVLDRRTGIPISLSVLYMEVAQKIALPLQGVGFPGHFLVKHTSVNEEIVIDPFNQGEIRSRKHLQTMLNRLYGDKVSSDPEFLAATSKKQILRRMLNNLQLIYVRENDLIKGLSIVERLLVLDPTSAEGIRDRGIIYLRLECFKQALEDLQTYLSLAPQAEDADAIRDQIAVLMRQVAQIH
jgi:regulator of sirC expression with transglutaminase-like and TPR domain